MKKLLMGLAILAMPIVMFANSYKVSKVKGNVTVKTADGEFYTVEEGTTVDEEDTLIVEDKSMVQFFLEDGTPITIRANGNYKVKDLVKK